VNLPGAAVLAATLAASVLMPTLPALAADGTVEEPDGFRQRDYDAPVPAGLNGARTVSALQVERLQREQGAVVIDVIPQHRPPEGLADDDLWLPVEHEGVAGALWLPDTGFGTLAPVTLDYLLGHLDEATGARRDHPIVFYCRTDCWMSWNAAKRALQAGRTNVHWFRDGIEEWWFEGLPVDTLVPAAGPRLPGDAG